MSQYSDVGVTCSTLGYRPFGQLLVGSAYEGSLPPSVSGPLSDSASNPADSGSGVGSAVTVSPSETNSTPV